MYGILNLSGVRSKANLAAESACSFPLTPMCLGIKHIIISLQFDIESSLLSSFIIRDQLNGIQCRPGSNGMKEVGRIFLSSKIRVRYLASYP